MIKKNSKTPKSRIVSKCKTKKTKKIVTDISSCIWNVYLFNHMYITPFSHERMHMWLDLDPTRGMAVTKGKGNVG